MEDILIDTSVFVEFIRTGRGVYLELLEQRNAQQVALMTSTAVIFELWSGESMEKKTKRADLEEMLSTITIFPVTSDIAKQAGELRRLKLANGIDALIAATALVERAELATLNTKHFVGISQLKLWPLSS